MTAKTDPSIRTELETLSSAFVDALAGKVTDVSAYISTFSDRANVNSRNVIADEVLQKTKISQELNDYLSNLKKKFNNDQILQAIKSNYSDNTDFQGTKNITTPITDLTNLYLNSFSEELMAKLLSKISGTSSTSSTVTPATTATPVQINVLPKEMDADQQKQLNGYLTKVANLPIRFRDEDISTVSIPLGSGIQKYEVVQSNIPVQSYIPVADVPRITMDEQNRIIERELNEAIERTQSSVSSRSSRSSRSPSPVFREDIVQLEAPVSSVLKKRASPSRKGSKKGSKKSPRKSRGGSKSPKYVMARSLRHFFGSQKSSIGTVAKKIRKYAEEQGLLEGEAIVLDDLLKKVLDLKRASIKNKADLLKAIEKRMKKE